MLSIANEEVDLAIQAREAPSDIVQETIFEAQRDLDRFQGMTEAEMSAWLRMVLKRNIQNLHLKYRTHKRDLNREQRIHAQAGKDEPAIADPGPSPSTILVRQERTKTIETTINALPGDYRQVITLYYRKELTFRQVGLIMGRSEGAARQLWSRALLELSRQLKRQGNYE